MKRFLYRIYRKIAYFFRWIYVLAAKKRDALNHENRDKLIIISLASYPARFGSIHLMLKSIMLQTMKPDKIIVWLADDAVDHITAKMRELEKYGIEYRSVRGDLMPHKKYFYAMQEFPNDIIITVDDDSIYFADTIESLVKTHEKYPKAVCARRVSKMTKNPDGGIAPYIKWIGEYTGMTVPSHSLVPTGVGGVLYPPHCLYEKAFDEELIRKLCLKADDMWLKFMELLNGTKVAWAPCKIPVPKPIEKEQVQCLTNENVGKNSNDVYFANLQSFFNVKDEEFEIE